MPQQEAPLNPLVLVFVVVMAAFMVLLPRRFALVPFLLVAIFVPLGQVAMIAGLHFYMFRLMLLSGWTRVILRAEYRSYKITGIDIAVFLTVIIGFAAYVLLWGTAGALVYRLGIAFDAFGAYLLTRFMVRDSSDWTIILRALAIMSIPVAAVMVLEQVTGRNLLSVLGGVPALTEIRNGRFRSQGPFLHPILAGVFGAVLLPLFISLRWLVPKHKNSSFVAIVAAGAIVVTSGSSGPILAALAGLVALSCWPIRKSMRLIRWASALMIIGLQIIMKAPVWALVGRMRVFDASSGDHRWVLIDAFISRFNEWWLLGTKTTAHWGYLLIDICNMYVRTGVDGGLGALIALIAVIALCFRNVGRAVRHTHDRNLQKALWALGASVFAMTVAFIDVQLFDQTIAIWYLITGSISVLTMRAIQDARATGQGRQLKSLGAVEPELDADQPPSRDVEDADSYVAAAESLSDLADIQLQHWSDRRTARSEPRC